MLSSAVPSPRSKGESKIRVSRRHTSLAAKSLTPDSMSSTNSSPPKRASVSDSPALAPHSGRSRAQRAVAGLVTVAIVDSLEAVEVHDDDADRISAPLPAR